MIKVEVIEDFTLRKFDELKNIVRKNRSEQGKLFKGDVFECDEKMAEYLTGGNALKKPFVKVIEILPKVEAKVKYDTGEPVSMKLTLDDVKVIAEEVNKTTKKTTKKKTSKN